MITFNEFINKYNGKYVDYDGKFGCQCTDLMRQYVKEVLGTDPYKAIPQTGNAKDIFNNFPLAGNQYFWKIANAPTNSPKNGDIVFWRTYPLVTGLAGHVAINSSADANNLITFDQNYGSPNNCRLIKHSYKGVLGWLTPRS